MNKLTAPVILLLVFAYSACKPTKPIQPVTTAEAEKFALDVEEAMRKGRTELLDNVIDEQEFSKRVASALGMKNMNKRVVKDVARGINEASFGKKILASLGEDGTYELVKVYNKEGHQHMIFRMLGSETGLNYHDFELLKRADKIGAADIFIYTLGENFSATIGQLVNAAGNADKGSKTAKELGRLTEVRGLIQRQKYEEANRIMESLSMDLQKQKSFLLLRAEIASGSGNDSLYMNILNELNERYPNEPNMHLMMMEKHFMAKDYEKALESVNKMDALINKDPYLDYYRALMLNQLNRNSEAITHLERLHTNMPNYSMGALELMVNYYDAGMKDKATALKEAYRKNSRLDQKKLDQVIAVYPGL